MLSWERLMCSGFTQCSCEVWPYLWICTRLGVSPGLVMKGTCTFGKRCG
jgi:hypothetical protein